MRKYHGMRSCINIKPSSMSRINMNRLKWSYLKCLANDNCMLFAEYTYLLKLNERRNTMSKFTNDTPDKNWNIITQVFLCLKSMDASFFFYNDLELALIPIAQDRTYLQVTINLSVKFLKLASNHCPSQDVA